MIKGDKSSKRSAAQKSALAKEERPKIELLKELISLLSAIGITVRREELKRGIGWRAVSGSCRALSERLIILDRQIALDEQIAFLLSKCQELAIELPASVQSKLLHSKVPVDDSPLVYSPAVPGVTVTTDSVSS